MNIRRRALTVALAASPLVLATNARAQGARAVKVIVSTSPATGPDIVARKFGELFAAELGQPVVVENRAGASGNIGSTAIARAQPDGSTLGVISNYFVINPSLSKLPFDTVGDIEPICLLARGGMALVSKTLGPISLRAFIAKAKAQPDTLTYATAGVGTPQHMAIALLEKVAGIKLRHIPYSGMAGAVVATLAGEVDVLFMGVHTAISHVKNGKLHALALSGRKPSPLLPGVPVASAAGAPGLDVDLWFGLVGPSGMPRQTLQRIEAAAATAIANEKLAAALKEMGLEAEYLPSEAFAGMIKAEIAQWADVVKTAGIKSS